MTHILVPMVVAALVRVAFLVSNWDSPFFVHPIIDAREFHEEALAIGSIEGLPARPFDRPPLFSYFVALVYALAGPSMRAVFLVHTLLGVLTVGLTAHAGARLFGRRAGLLAGLTLALARLPLVLEGQLLGETLQTFLLAAMLAALVGATREGPADRALPRWVRLRPDALVVLAAIAGALAMLTRPSSGLFVVPALALMVGARRSADRAASARGHARAALVGVLIVAATVGTVTLRNRVVGGEWVLVSYNGGINFFIGNGTRHDELIDIRPGLRWERLARTPRALERSGVFEIDPWADGFAAWDRRYYRAALEDIAGDPLAWLGRLSRKALRFWSRVEVERNVHPGAFVSPRSFLGSVTIPFAAIAPFALAGLALATWRRIRRCDHVPREAWLLVVAVAATWGTCVLFFVTARYRAPAYPAMAILGAWLVCVLAGAITSMRRDAGRWRLRPLLVVVGAVLVSGAIVLADPGGAGGIAAARAEHLEAIVLEGTGRNREALEAHQRALLAYPDDPDVVAAPMSLLMAMGRPGEAIPLGERSSALLPDHPTPLFNLGLAYQMAGRFEEAVHAFERVAGVSPGDARAHYQIGRSLVLAGRPDASLAPLSRAETLAPAMPLPLIERARALARLARPIEARSALESARRLDPAVSAMIAADPELARIAR